MLFVECLGARFLLNAVINDLDHTSLSDDILFFETILIFFFCNGLLRKWLKGEFKIENFLYKKFFQNVYYQWYLKLQNGQFSKLSRITSISFILGPFGCKNMLFFKNLAKCCNLTELIIYGFYLHHLISSEAINVMSTRMRRNESLRLEFLEFSFNPNIGQEYSFFEALAFCSHLKTLNFTNCDLSERSVQSLETALESNIYELEILNISSNLVIGRSKALFEILKRCPNLRCYTFTVVN